MASLSDALLNFSVTVEVFMKALTAAVPGICDIENAAIEYQHARMMAGVIFPAARADDPKPWLAAIRLPEVPDVYND